MTFFTLFGEQLPPTQAFTLLVLEKSETGFALWRYAQAAAVIHFADLKARGLLPGDATDPGMYRQQKRRDHTQYNYRQSGEAKTSPSHCLPDAARGVPGLRLSEPQGYYSWQQPRHFPVNVLPDIRTPSGSGVSAC